MGIHRPLGTGVQFSGTNAGSFTIGSDSSMSAISPAGTGAADIAVTNETETSALSCLVVPANGLAGSYSGTLTVTVAPPS